VKRVLVLGIDGFIGHHLTRAILSQTDWEVHGIDMHDDRIAEWIGHPRLRFFEGDITINREWIEYHVKKCDVVLPLVAIATPATYVREPLRVFELDFEANLPVVRHCLHYGKHLVFPSTSEVYGMCRDERFDPETSELVYGPISKQRWIYACSKQLMDRVIHAYGLERGLRYTLFRPFNWIGGGLDSIDTPREGSSRVVTQFFGHIVRGEPIRLVDGGLQRRSFTFVDDGIAALMKIIENRDDRACGRIYNIGNPANHHSVRELAQVDVAGRDLSPGVDDGDERPSDRGERQACAAQHRPCGRTAPPLLDSIAVHGTSDGGPGPQIREQIRKTPLPLPRCGASSLRSRTQD